ncbi:MAG: hypothetical protein M3450_10430 [Actinomycetota bacterium]|nr:hypothetical protein [Actinomycetota bacterium]
MKPPRAARTRPRPTPALEAALALSRSDPISMAAPAATTLKVASTTNASQRLPQLTPNSTMVANMM